MPADPIAIPIFCPVVKPETEVSEDKGVIVADGKVVEVLRVMALVILLPETCENTVRTLLLVEVKETATEGPNVEVREC